MATYLDGNVRKATANTVRAMERSAERRKCPKCGRKSALKKDHEMQATYCRWSLETRVVTERSMSQPSVIGSRARALCDYYQPWNPE